MLITSFECRNLMLKIVDHVLANPVPDIRQGGSHLLSLPPLHVPPPSPIVRFRTLVLSPILLLPRNDDIFICHLLLFSSLPPPGPFPPV